MSNNQIKNPGSITDIPGTNQPGVNRTPGDDRDQSGWQNYPENIDEIAEPVENQKSNEADLTEEIIQQLIAENTQPLGNEQRLQEQPHPENDAIHQLLPEPSLITAAHPDDIDRIDLGLPQSGADEHYLEHQLEELSKRNLTTAPPPPLPEITPQSDEQLKVEALERWLDKPMPQKESSSHWAVIGYTAACLGVAVLTYTGIYITGNYKTFDGPLVHAGSLVTGNSTAENRFSSSYTNAPQGSSSSSGSSNHSKNTANSRGDASSSDGSGAAKKAKTLSTAAVIISPGVKAAASACLTPDVQLKALPGGFSRITMNSECHSNQTVQLKYGGVTFDSRFDDKGSFSFVLDAFAGDNEQVQLLFHNGKQLMKRPVLEGMENISKIAVIWSSKENVDLHAFEYSARPNSTGHVWEQNPLTYNNAIQKMKALNSGRGFISTANKAVATPTKRVEVYTFLHNQENEQGVIKLALSYDTNSKVINTVSCNAGSDASYLSYQTIQLIKNSSANKEEGQIQINTCNTSNSKMQYLTKAIKDLILQ